MTEQRNYVRTKYEYEDEFGNITTIEQKNVEVNEDYPVDDALHMTERFVDFVNTCGFSRMTIMKALFEVAEDLEERLNNDTKHD